MYTRACIYISGGQTAKVGGGYINLYIYKYIFTYVHSYIYTYTCIHIQHAQ